MKKGVPFSFTKIQNSEGVILINPLFLTSSDGTKLAYYHVKAKAPIAALLFIHGGGAYSGAGYQHLANGLSEKYSISVYLLDIRGHGNSEGPRGDTPFPEQVFQDLNIMIDFIKKVYPTLPFYLGGHSSGGGLILNYFEWEKSSDIKGYFFISPQFGYKSNTTRENIKNPFVEINFKIVSDYESSQRNMFGNSYSVFFNYPEQILKAQPLLIKSITCNMSASLTPMNPQEQFSKIEKPFGLFIGEKDELFDPEKVISYAEFPEERVKARSINRIVKNENHLSILKVADNLIGEAILKMNNANLDKCLTSIQSSIPNHPDVAPC